ncbi:asparagine synthase-related protein [Marinilactibacillus psychrotolerans]|uniref:asparagine synthase-related protein n=1 Tax=Marinilactibacillus psychrotolerans TaxID=191770 RepID=UPI00388817F3
MLNEKELIQEYGKFYNFLGNHYPYVNEERVSLSIRKILTDNHLENNLDIVGIIEIVNKSYLFEDRTLVKGIKRVPWMTPLELKDNGKLEKLDMNLPDHSEIEENPENIAKSLKEILKKELKTYLKGKKKIGILLSGGLDSRIVAGLIKELELEGVYTGTVSAFTWGVEKSRDVIYSQYICKKFKWEFIHFPLTSSTLLENIYISGKMGAEFSPIHLHAMSNISNIQGVDGIIAGSYGDGVGRGEFSGIKVIDLPKFLKGNLNQFGIIRHKAINKYRNDVINDAYNYRNYIRRNKEYQYREIEQELHYMRRKLQACMSVIGLKIPLYQLFTSPEAVGLMWSLNPKVRNDSVYQHILKTLPYDTGSIPWARTGKAILENDETVDIDKGLKQHHNYGKWLRVDLANEIHELVFSPSIEGLGIFNMTVLERLYKIWIRSKTISTNSLDEIFSWVASLAVFINEYNVENHEKFESGISDIFYGSIGVVKAGIYSGLRNRLRD